LHNSKLIYISAKETPSISQSVQLNGWDDEGVLVGVILGVGVLVGVTVTVGVGVAVVQTHISFFSKLPLPEITVADL
jgi:hypothetical protein